MSFTFPGYVTPYWPLMFDLTTPSDLTLSTKYGETQQQWRNAWYLTHLHRRHSSMAATNNYFLLQTNLLIIPLHNHIIYNIYSKKKQTNACHKFPKSKVLSSNQYFFVLTTLTSTIDFNL